MKKRAQTAKSNKLDVETGIYAEYFKVSRTHQKEYGEQTVVFMQVGSFFEVYGIKDFETGDISGSVIVDVGELCQLAVVEKKAEYSNGAIVMAGVRDFVLEKYLQKLTENGYTVPVYVQHKDEWGKVSERTLDKVYSPGTYLSCETDSLPRTSNNIMSVWIECFKPSARSSNNRDTVVYGVAIINSFTGKSFLFQHETIFYMNATTFDELERCVSTYCPCEIIFLSPFDEKMSRTIAQFTGMLESSIYFINNDPTCEQRVKNCKEQVYLKQILETIFGDDAYNVCTEFQRGILATQAFCYLLNFTKEHNPDLIRKISFPEFNNSADRMF